MNFLFDNCCPLLLVRFMREICKSDGHWVSHHRDMPGLGEDRGDEHWIKFLSEQEETYVAVTIDYNILKNTAIRKVLRNSGLTAFVFSEKHLPSQPWHELSWRILKTWPNIVKFSEATPKNNIYRIDKSLEVKKFSFTSDD